MKGQNTRVGEPKPNLAQQQRTLLEQEVYNRRADQVGNTNTHTYTCIHPIFFNAILPDVLCDFKFLSHLIAGAPHNRDKWARVF
jgi:hypothetical protein